MGQYCLTRNCGRGGNSNRSFLREAQLHLVLFSVTLFSRIICVLTIVLDSFSCSFILVSNL